MVQANRLIEELQKAAPHGSEHLVMVLLPGMPPISINSVQAEYHEDADGSTTVWLHCEEM
jgi:hypothetical protein